MKKQSNSERWKKSAQRVFTWVLIFFGCTVALSKTVAADERIPATGKTYYVDSRSGNDQNNGRSPSHPWRSLQKIGRTTFSPGDRILLKSGGQWRGQLWPKGSGKEGAPIIIDLYGGGVLPAIHGAGLFPDAVLLRNQEYWEIQNLEITNEGSGTAVRRAVHVDAVNSGDLHHIYLRNLLIHDVNGSDAVKHNGGINYTCEGERKPSRFVDLRIENNNIYRTDRSGIFGWSSHWLRSKWNPTKGLIVRGNRLSDIGGDGIVVVAADGALVEHNVVAHANQRSAGYNVAIWAWSSDNSVIQHNEAYGTHGQRDGEGFDSDWNSRGTIIQYNYSHDNDGGFLLICNEGGHSDRESIGNIGTVVRYNISVNDRTRGINISGPVQHSEIYNNTIYVGEGHDVDLVQYADWHGWSRETHFYNNIFYVKGSAKIGYGIARNADGSYVSAPGYGESQGNRFDSNVYFGNITPPNDPHALTSDPLLTDPEVSDSGSWTPGKYRLRVGSPATDSGITIEDNGGRDFFGSPVGLCGGTDRGAAERLECERN